MRDHQRARSSTEEAVTAEPQQSISEGDLAQRAQSAELNGQPGPLSSLGAWAAELEQTGVGRWFLQLGIKDSHAEKLAKVSMGADDAHVSRQAFAEAMNILAGGEPGTADRLERPDDPVSRAEAVTLAQRSHGYDEALPEGEVAYFLDVPESAWFFESAHAARRNGVVKGNNNFFRPHDPLPWAHAKYIFDALESPGPIPPAEQCPDAEVLREPADVTRRLGAEGTLSPAEIAEIRALIAEMPAEQQAALYQQLASKVSYRSQRDNSGAAGIRPDYMCSVTSIAMVLNSMGIEVDEGGAQFEDQLMQIVQDRGLNYKGKLAHQAAVSAHGVDLERLHTPAFGSAAEAQDFYEEKVVHRLEAGETATLSVKTAETGEGHIVRLEWVERDGLRVDDPFGALTVAGAANWYQRNSFTGSTGDGAKGEDNFWPWDWVARFNSKRYVQFYFHQ